MKGFSFDSLHVKLIFIVLIATLPALAVVIYNGMVDRAHWREHALRDALYLAKNISAAQDDIIRNTRNTLVFVSEILGSYGLESEAAKGLLIRLLERAPTVAAILIAEPPSLMFFGKNIYPKRRLTAPFLTP